MAIYVYHNPDFLEFYRGAGPETPDLGCLYLAAIVDTDEPRIAYYFTQHLGMDWFEHPNVTAVVHSRSTSVGDVLETEDGRLLLVAPFGFTELEDKRLPAESSAFVQALRALVAGEETGEDAQRTLAPQARYLYTALLFAAYALESLSDEEARSGPDRALLTRFAAEQARWALAQADGG
jgi:hypothetical protein